MTSEEQHYHDMMAIIDGGKRDSMRIFYGVLVFALAALAVLAIIVACPKAHADPDDSDAGSSKTDSVCTAYNLGVPEAQIPGLLRKNDGRENYNQSQRDTVWPIIEGECG
jgi:hypothetical protein